MDTRYLYNVAFSRWHCCYQNFRNSFGENARDLGPCLGLRAIPVDM